MNPYLHPQMTKLMMGNINLKNRFHRFYPKFQMGGTIPSYESGVAGGLVDCSLSAGPEVINDDLPGCSNSAGPSQELAVIPYPEPTVVPVPCQVVEQSHSPIVVQQLEQAAAQQPGSGINVVIPYPLSLSRFFVLPPIVVQFGLRFVQRLKLQNYKRWRINEEVKVFMEQQLRELLPQPWVILEQQNGLPAIPFWDPVMEIIPDVEGELVPFYRNLARTPILDGLTGSSLLLVSELNLFPFNPFFFPFFFLKRKNFVVFVQDDESSFGCLVPGHRGSSAVCKLGEQISSSFL